MTNWPLPQGTYGIAHHLPGLGGGLVAEGFTVTDEQGTQVLRFVYRLHGTTMTWSIVTPDGNERARMTHPMVSMHPHFTVDRPNHGEVTVQKSSIAAMHETWRIEGLGDGDGAAEQVNVRGDIAQHEFTFTDTHNTPVASASRAYITVHEGFSVRTHGLDPLIALCAAVGIDLIENSHDR